MKVFYFVIVLIFSLNSAQVLASPLERCWNWTASLGQKVFLPAIPKKEVPKLPRGAFEVWMTSEWVGQQKQVFFQVMTFDGNKSSSWPATRQDIEAWKDAGYFDPQSSTILSTNAGADTQGGIRVPFKSKYKYYGIRH